MVSMPRCLWRFEALDKVARSNAIKLGSGWLGLRFVPQFRKVPQSLYFCPVTNAKLFFSLFNQHVCKDIFQLQQISQHNSNPPLVPPPPDSSQGLHHVQSVQARVGWLFVFLNAGQRSRKRLSVECQQASIQNSKMRNGRAPLLTLHPPHASMARTLELKLFWKLFLDDAVKFKDSTDRDVSSPERPEGRVCRHRVRLHHYNLGAMPLQCCNHTTWNVEHGTPSGWENNHPRTHTHPQEGFKILFDTKGHKLTNWHLTPPISHTWLMTWDVFFLCAITLGQP